MPPFLTGGSMITRVTLQDATWNETPWKFEAGTPAIAEAVGLAAAVDYLDGIGMDRVRAHERALFEAAWSRLGSLPGVRLLGPESPDEHAGVISFLLDGIHPHDVAAVLDGEGIAVRAGHHCAQPLMDRYGLAATTRASFSVYNDVDDVDRLADAVGAVQRLFAAH
jgi:cysteine desulfurase/selenocysteine lyase